MVPPLALDIDGTLTTPAGTLDPRIFEVLPAWDAPVVLATGKAFPYPVTLCHYLRIPETVVAENGGVVLVGENVSFQGDRDRAQAVAEEFVARGGDLGWGAAETINRWRETEIAVQVDQDEALLREVADEYEMEVVNTGYALHVKSPNVAKGDGLRVVADALGYDPEAFVAVGDSVNDVSTFDAAGDSFAVANADDDARAAADVVLDEAFCAGTLSVLEALDA